MSRHVTCHVSHIIRFLHDVITAVINDTGTLSGLFDGSEMNSDNVKVSSKKTKLQPSFSNIYNILHIQDKESKVEFLGKLIDALSFSTGQTLSAKPGKIVSGQEAEKTNEMLQAWKYMELLLLHVIFSPSS